MKLPELKRYTAGLAALLATALLSACGALGPSNLEIAGPSAVGMDESDARALRAGMQEAVEAGQISGAVLLVANDSEAGVLEAVGTQGPNDDTPMNQHTLFRIYSMSKPIVSVATLSMVEDGLLSLNDPVSQYIPAYETLTIMDEEGQTRPATRIMTVQDLLTHESGLIYGTFDPQSALGRLYLDNGSMSFDMTALELAERLGELPLRFEPGTRWHYSRSTDVLGAVLEVAAGQPLDELLSERIFDPLGMDDTSFYIAESEADRLAQPIHGDLSTPLVEQPMLSGGGGLNSTTEDYARFGFMLLNRGEYQGARIIAPETLDLMTTEFIGAGVSRQDFFYGDAGDFGLGFGLRPINPADPSSPVTFGWGGLAGTDFWVDPTNNLFAVYMIQARDIPGGASFNARRAVYEALAN